MKKIERRSNLSYAEFVQEYALPQRPVIISDAARHWESARRWTPTMFKERFGTREFRIAGKRQQLAEFIDRVVESTDSDPAPYFHNVEIVSRFPELLPEVPHFEYAQPDRVNSRLLPRRLMKTGWYELFIGGAGGQFPDLHTDFRGVFSLLTQLHGDKECVFFSPDQTRLLYPREDNRRRSPVDPFSPDLERFPLFSQAQPLRCVVKQGESLFVPPDWWHTTRMQGPSISVVSSHLTSSNWWNFVRDEFRRREKLTAIPICAYLVAVGILLSVRERCTFASPS